jgi:hypothetical protein
MIEPNDVSHIHSNGIRALAHAIPAPAGAA